METSYEYRVFIEASQVRELCINHQFYTRGDNEAYSKMLSKCGIVQPDDLIEMAQDIVDHSDESNEYLVAYEPLDEVLAYLQELCRVEVISIRKHEDSKKSTGRFTRTVRR